METQQTIPGGYTRLHVFLFSMAYLWTMLTLDVVYSLLLVHGYMRNRVTARRERLEARQIATRIPVTSVARHDDLSSSPDAGLNSDMEQAA